VTTNATFRKEHETYLGYPEGSFINYFDQYFGIGWIMTYVAFWLLVLAASKYATHKTRKGFLFYSQYTLLQIYYWVILAKLLVFVLLALGLWLGHQQGWFRTVKPIHSLNREYILLIGAHLLKTLSLAFFTDSNADVPMLVMLCQSSVGLKAMNPNPNPDTNPDANRKRNCIPRMGGTGNPTMTRFG